MPNWCTNSLKVTGPTGALSEFTLRAFGLDGDVIDNLACGVVNGTELQGTETADEVRSRIIVDALMAERDESCFSFSRHIPMPEELQGTVSPTPTNTEEECRRNLELRELYGYDNWYNWCVSNWGCKWDASHMDPPTVDATQVRIRFETPWSPPLPWLETVHEIHPELTFELACEEESGAFSALLVLGPEIREDIDMQQKPVEERKAFYLEWFDWDWEPATDDEDDD